MAIGLLGLGLVWLLTLGALLRRGDARAKAQARDIGAGGLLLVAVLGFFWRTLSGDVYQPADGGDLVSFLFPTYRFAAHQLAQGALPLWNPHLYGGAPFISDIQAGFLYVPHLLLFMAWPDFPYVALQWSAILHLYWAGLGVYVLLRTLEWNQARTLSRPAAFFGALAFALSDPLLVHLGNLNLIAVLSWLPWVLAAFSRACLPRAGDAGQARRRLLWAAVAGGLFALANYAGHAQSTFYIALALGLFALGASFAGSTETRLRARLRRNLVALAMSGGLALLLTAPILLPALELSDYSSRSQFSYQESIAFSLAPTQAIGLVTPGFFGRGPALHWSLWDRVETPYAGVATLLLAIAALPLALPQDRRRLWVWLGIALFGFVTALGVYTLIHGWLAWAIPPFGQLRAPARALALWTLGASVLAAYGLDAVLARYLRVSFGTDSGTDNPTTLSALRSEAYLRFVRGGAWVWFSIVLPLVFLALLLTQGDDAAFLRASLAALALCIAAMCWLVFWLLLAAYRAGWFGPTLGAVLLIGLLYLDLGATGAYTDIAATDPTRGYAHPDVVEFLRADGELFRIDTRTGMEHLWQPDTAALHGLQDVGGIANPLMLAHWRDFWESTGGRQARAYDFLNVKYVLVEGDTPLPAGKFVRVLESPTGVTVYENQDFWPRAWVVHRAENVAEPAAALARLRQGEVDLAQTVLVSGEGAADGAAAAIRTEATATVTHYGSRDMTVTVSSPAAGYLVLSEVWYPGWHATVNGAGAPVLRANFAQRAVPIPAGETTVELWFWPRLWAWGLALAGVGIVLLVGVVVWRVRGGKEP